MPPEDVLVARLRAGDDAAFALVLDAWSPAMLRAARRTVPTPDLAAEVVQDTWLAVLEELPGFEGPVLAEDLKPTAGHRPERVAMALASAGLSLTRNLAVVAVTQVVLVLLAMALSIHVARLLRDAVPSSIRDGVASAVGASSWIAFLAFGLVSRSFGVGTAG